MITNEILKFKPKIPKCQNITEAENKALKSLCQNTNIVIKPADKGGAVVIMNKVDYINEGLPQLQDTKFYRKITKDPTKKTSLEITNFLKERKLLPTEH